MLGLRQKIGGDKCWIGCFISHNHHFRRSCRQIDKRVGLFRHKRLCKHDVKIAGTENLVYFWYCFSSECHCRYRLCASSLIHLGYASQTCRHKDCRVDATALVGRRADGNLGASGKACRDGKHQRR